jgi:hypothetical protein
VTRHPYTRFAPTLTPLGARDCPAASAIVVGHDLFIATDPGSDAVLIREDGRGHVTATVRGADGVHYAAGAIDRVFVHLRGSHDQLDFVLTAPQVRAAGVVIDAGRGGDQRLRLEVPPAPGTGRLAIDLRGDPGAGGADVWVGRGGLGGVTITNRMAGGSVRVHDPACAPHNPPDPPVRVPLG